MADISPDFDWVTVRRDCQLGEMFTRLRALAEANVTTRNGQLTGKPRYGFEQRGDGAFTVWDQESTVRDAVDFDVLNDRIYVRRISDKFEVTLTMTSAGVCKYKVGHEELDAWQVLKKALEPMLFR
jgi:hypothetical protein